MKRDLEWLYNACGPEGDAAAMHQVARDLRASGDRAAAATAYDRAFGLGPFDPVLRREREELLDELAVVEHGITFRYIPAGSFLMGSETGDADERPVHPVRLEEYWLAETPISWADYCALLGWEPPPLGLPPETVHENEEKWVHFARFNVRKIRLQYCEDETLRAMDWHAHVPATPGSSRPHFKTPPRNHPDEQWSYARKPLIAAGFQEAEELCALLGGEAARYRLPTEAEWERAARGAWIGCRYPWGDAPPHPEICDFNRFDERSIRPMRDCPPNDYGLYAMSGCVWEWTSDRYDARYYDVSPRRNPSGSLDGEERVVRGGSWADCAEAVTVSFRSSRPVSAASPREVTQRSPNLGLRICRIRVGGDGVSR